MNLTPGGNEDYSVHVYLVDTRAELNNLNHGLMLSEITPLLIGAGDERFRCGNRFIITSQSEAGFEIYGITGIRYNYYFCFLLFFQLTFTLSENNINNLALFLLVTRNKGEGEGNTPSA